MKPNHAFKYIATAALVSLIASSAFAEEILVDLPNFGDPVTETPQNTPVKPTTPAPTTSTTPRVPEKKTETTAAKPAPKTPEKKPTPAPAPKPKAPVQEERQSDAWKANDRALYNSYEGTITEIYADNRARFVFEDGSSGVYSLSSLVHIVKSLDGWHINERAMKSNYEGTITRIYSNGTARFVFDDGSSGIYSISSFVRIVNSLNGWSVGQRAMRNNYEGTVTKMYGNDTALFVYDDGSSGIYSLSSLTRMANSLNGWSVGERAMLNNYEGTIRTIYSNGTALMLFDDGSSGIYRLSTFVHIVKSINGWNVGDKIMMNNYEGTIKNIYSNGTAVIIFDDGSGGTYATSSFVRVVKSINGWSVSERAMMNNYEGTIKRLYGNGIADFIFDDGSSGFYNTTKFIRIVKSLNGWSVGQRALMGNYTGIISKIYANGTAFVVFDDGSSSFYNLSRLIRIK